LVAVGEFVREFGNLTATHISSIHWDSLLLLASSYIHNPTRKWWCTLLPLMQHERAVFRQAGALLCHGALCSAAAVPAPLLLPPPGELQEYVVSELNVVQLEVCDDVLRYAELVAEPDWGLLGKKLGKDMGKVGFVGGGCLCVGGGHGTVFAGTEFACWSGLERGGCLGIYVGKKLGKDIGKVGGEGQQQQQQQQQQQWAHAVVLGAQLPMQLGARKPGHRHHHYLC
jgi:hypothetical protein